MRAFAFIAVLAIGCGASDGEWAAAQMALSSEGLAPGEVGSVVLLVLDGKGAACKRVLEAASPLDDPELEVVRHARFAVDGSTKLLSIPAGRKLVFYAEGFARADGWGPRVGRGCAEAKLQAGTASGISIVIQRDARD